MTLRFRSRVVVGVLLWAALLPAAAGAQPAPRDAAQGSGQSYWGPIPPPAAEVTVRPETTGRSAWEWPLYVPYRVVGLPVQLTTLGLKATVIGLDDAGVVGRIANLFGAYDLPYGFRVVGDISSTVGGAVGLTFFHESLFDDHTELQLKGKIGTEGRSKLTGGMLIPRGDDGSFFDLGGGHTALDNAAYFGVGPSTDVKDEGHFTREMTWAGGTYRHAWGAGFATEGLGLFSALRNRETPDEEETLHELYADDLPVGTGLHSDGFDVALTLLHEDVEDDGRPTHGGIRRFKIGRYLPTVDTDNPFTNYRADVTQFLKLWHGRGLALRGVWTWIDAGSDPVHFQRLFSFDKPDEVRGFERSRFRGQGLTLLSLEYRFPTWAYRGPQGTGIDTYVFFDWGQVFNAREEIGFRNFREGVGGGFRWISRDGYGGSFEVAVSEEEVVLRVRTDQNFQYARHGFYHGRIPVPSY